MSTRSILPAASYNCLAVAYDTRNRPWPSADEQLTLQRTFEPARFVDVVPLRLSKPLAGLGRVPERLRFVLQLWDVEQSELLWEETVHYLHPSESPTATSTPTMAPSITPTGTSTPNKARNCDQYANKDTNENTDSADINPKKDANADENPNAGRRNRA